MTNPAIASLAGPALVVLAFCVVLLAAASAAAKGVRDRRGARRRATAQKHRPTAIALAGGLTPSRELPTERGESEELDRAMIDILPLLRGDDRTGLLRALEDRGVVDRARRETYSRRSLRRAGAAETLGVCGTRRALPELGRLLRDRDPEVRVVAARALGRLGGAGAVPFLLASLEKPRPLPLSIVTMALMHVGPAAIDELREGLRSPSPRAREAAAAILGQHGAIGALDELIDALGDRDATVRARAASAVGRIGSPRAVDRLLEILGDGDELEVRRAAVTALGAIGSPRAIDALGAQLEETDSTLSLNAAGALGRIGEPGARVLRGRVDEPGQTGGHAREALADAARRAAPRVPVRARTGAT